MKDNLLFLMMGVCCFSVLSCGGGDDLLGAKGEACVIDDDCRQALVCDDRVCREGIGEDSNRSASNTSQGGETSNTSDSNSGSNTSTPTSGSNMTPTDPLSNTPNPNPDPMFSEVCENFCTLLPCIGFDSDNCLEDCEDSIASDQDFAAFVECISDFDCEEIDEGEANACFDDFEDKTFRFVMVEDMSSGGTRGTPGADLDAIGVNIDGTEFFATTVEDFNISQGRFDDNYASDPFSLIGEPDAGCELENFVSLGGAEGDGYVIVGFSNSEEEVRFGSGAVVTVYELGPTLCPERSSWFDDDYTVSISVSNARGDFEVVGVGTSGVNSFMIP